MGRGRKVESVLSELPEPTESQAIVRVTGTPGGNLVQVQDAVETIADTASADNELLQVQGWQVECIDDFARHKLVVDVLVLRHELRVCTCLWARRDRPSRGGHRPE